MPGWPEQQHPIAPSLMAHTFRVKHNVVANLIGSAWSMLASLAMLPVYLHLLGAEGYGLLGIHAALLMVFSLCDLGLAVTLNRELARRSATDPDYRACRDLLRTLEVIYWSVGGGIAMITAAIAPLIASHWVRSEALGHNDVALAVFIMAMSFALNWPVALYLNGIMGQQRHVLLNIITVINVSLLHIGAVVILLFVSRTIHAYLLWNLGLGTINTVLLACLVWRGLPASAHRPRFRPGLLREHWRFSAGMMLISVAVTVLTQLDKFLVSKQLSLEVFGYYAFATRISVAIHRLVTPLHTALFPRFSQLAAAGDHDHIATLYHRACQLAVFIVAPIVVTLVCFTEPILLLWVRDPTGVEQLRPLVAFLAIGAGLKTLIVFAYSLQVAYGWTRLILLANVIAIICEVPVMMLLTRWYGAPGAAVTWVIISAGFVFFQSPLMHRRLLPGHLGRWAWQDVLVPIGASLLIVGLARLAMPLSDHDAAQAMQIVMVYAVAATLTGMSMPHTREMMGQTFAWVNTCLLRRSST